MKRTTIFGKDRTTLELAALFVFVLVLVANLVVVRFSEGYFQHFGISLSEVNYTPQMYDYVRIALPIIIGSIVVTVAALCLIGLSIYIGNLLARFFRPSKGAIKYVGKHRKFFERLANILGLLIKVTLGAASIWILWTALYSVSAEAGKMSAANTVKMSSISKPGDNLQRVIIYKGNNELILKTYDNSKKEFLSGYSVVSGTDYDARTIDL